MNPILPLNHFIPDVEARVWADGRMYLYGSMDIGGNLSYCSHEYRVFSSPDLKTWTDHGESFRTLGQGAKVPWTTAPLFAPDCVFSNGLYRLFFCCADKSEGMAVSSSPCGPFTNATAIEGANGDAIDPAVLVDDDGQVYYYWGQLHLRVARLKPDYSGIDRATFNPSLLNEKEHGFHEGTCIRKRRGFYYVIYTDTSRGKATALAYATSSSPMGPFTKQGIIIDNLGCDRETWNNHGSICEFQGNWYVFYHRSSQGSVFNRRVCVEPISFDAEGRIAEVDMTTQGIDGPLPANKTLEACRACLLSGKVRTSLSTLSDHEFLFDIKHGDWAAYKYLDFGAGATTFEATVAPGPYGGNIEIRLDHPNGALVGTLKVEPKASWQGWKTLHCPITSVSGVHALYLSFVGPQTPYWHNILHLESFRFS